MISPVKKALVVPASPEAAFRRFTDEIATWWPLATHSVGQDRAETCAIEGRVGGRVYERLEDGTTHPWGTVTVWDPPRRMAMTWHPGHEASPEQVVEVRFSPVNGGTRVELTHTGWEALGDRAGAERQSYDRGWDYVLSRFQPAGERAATTA